LRGDCMRTGSAESEAKQEKNTWKKAHRRAALLLSSGYAFASEGEQSQLGFCGNCRNSSAMALRAKLQWIVPGLLWLWVFAHLSWEWTLNSQYNYGWAVPALGALMFYLRWRRRPVPDLPGRGAPRVTLVLFAVLLLLLPLRVVEEANPDWRLLSWGLALCVIVYSLLSLFRVGSASWLRHFAFPVLFPLAAVPWPVQFENITVQTMTRGVAYVAVEMAGWFGVGAYQIGNVIQLRNGFVGVDQACSGVKTLQAGLMVALVLGELPELRWMKRIALLVVGSAWIFLCNVVRATALMFVCAHSGLNALARWHDLIGAVALVLGMAGMLGLAWFWKGELRNAAGNNTVRAHPTSAAPSWWMAVAWLALIFVGTEVWYRAHEGDLIERPAWDARWPEGNDTVTPLTIPESTRVILRYNSAKTAAWETPPGVRWWSFFALWKPQRAALQLVRSHSPDICLPAVGRTFRGGRPGVTVNAGSVSLDFRSYEFDQHGRHLFVFVGIQDDKQNRAAEAQSADLNFGGRLRAAWQGKRNLGQRLLEVAVLGYEDFGQAREAFSKTAEAIVAPGKTTD
jgi:exosortase